MFNPFAIFDVKATVKIKLIVINEFIVVDFIGRGYLSMELATLFLYRFLLLGIGNPFIV